MWGEDRDRPGVFAGSHPLARDDELTLTRNSWGQDIVGWSSILLVDLILAVQEHFHIKISAEEADRLRSMGDLADLIAAKQA